LAWDSWLSINGSNSQMGAACIVCKKSDNHELYQCKILDNKVCSNCGNVGHWWSGCEILSTSKPPNNRDKNLWDSFALKFGGCKFCFLDHKLVSNVGDASQRGKCKGRSPFKRIILNIFWKDLNVFERFYADIGLTKEDLNLLQDHRSVFHRIILNGFCQLSFHKRYEWFKHALTKL
jgi:hypothetical protein